MTDKRGNNGNRDRIYFLVLQNHCRWSCSHEVKKHLLFGRKAGHDSIVKSRDTSLLPNIHIVKAMFFLLLLYGCESWTIKLSTEELMLSNCGAGEDLRVPWTARKSKQSVLKEVNPSIHWKDWCWSWSSNTLSIWCEGLTHWKRRWCWERLRAVGKEDNRRGDGCMASLTQWTWVWANPREAWHAAVPGITKSWTWLSNWTHTSLH